MIPSLPPHRRALVRLGLVPLLVAGALAGGLGYLRHIWPAPRPFVVPRDRTPVALVPVTRDAAWVTAIEDTRCLAFLDDYLGRPGWTLTLVTGSSACFGDTAHGTLALDADGDATWSADGVPPRPLHLTPLQIARLHAAMDESCARPEDSYRDTVRFVKVHWGGREAPAFRVPESAAQEALDAFITDAVAP